MKYLLLFALVLPVRDKAPSNVIGLGDYRIGITTSESLNRANFTEEEPSYVKGTIALPCTHIQTFRSAMVTIAGVPVANVVLTFYDNTLFRISCDYSDSLKAAFLEKHGPGVVKPMSRFQFCPEKKDKLLLMWGESWPGVDTVALVVHRKGYTADCRLEEGVRLTIVGKRMLALSSDCDVKPADPFTDEFMKSL